MQADPGAARHRGELYAALAATAFGSAYVATAFALRGFEPLPAAAWRSVVAVVGLAAVLAVSRRSAVGRTPAATPAERPRAERALRLLVVAILSGPVFIVSMNLAVAHVGATIAAFVAGMYAILSAVIAPAFLPERLAPRVLLGFVLALCGTTLLAELDPGGSDAAGIAWGVVAAAAFALFLVLSRRWSAAYRLDGRVISISSMSVTALTVGGLVLLTDPSSMLPPSPPPEAIAAVAWLAGAAVLGQLLTIASVRLVPAARSAAFLLLNPITATILAALLLAERPTAIQLAGGALVLLGIAAATLPVRSLQRDPAPT